jgi:hypothetical protein
MQHPHKFKVTHIIPLSLQNQVIDPLIQLLAVLHTGLPTWKVLLFIPDHASNPYVALFFSRNGD